MKNLNLNAMGIQEMNCAEMQSTDGGCFLTALIIGAVAAICVLVATKNGGHDIDCPL